MDVAHLAAILLQSKVEKQRITEKLAAGHVKLWCELFDVRWTLKAMSDYIV